MKLSCLLLAYSVKSEQPGSLTGREGSRIIWEDDSATNHILYKTTVGKLLLIVIVGYYC